MPAAADWAKTFAICAVMMAHAGPFAFTPLDPIDRFARVTLAAFHVPVFLAVSGYLHATATPLAGPALRARLRRVLGPYALASLAVTAAGLNPPFATWALLPWNLLTGSALGVYYYVPVWCGCVATGLLWSRCSASGLVTALGLVTLATGARMQWPPLTSFVWHLRDPLEQGWALCYLVGWCARRFAWDRTLSMYPGTALLGVACTLPWFTASAPGFRLPYALGVLILVATLAPPAPAAVRWLGRETLWIYLAHIPIMQAVLAAVPNAAPVPRIVAATTVTLATCAGGIWAWRTMAAHLGRPSMSR